MKFEALISETAIKELSKLEPEIKERIKNKLLLLEEDPFKSRPLADIKKLKGFSNPFLYRLRIGDYRLIYTIQEKFVKIVHIFPRGKGYAWLE